MFKTGVDFDETFSTDIGPIGVLAEVVADGDHLQLLDLAVYPTETSNRLRIGTNQVREIYRAIALSARSEGFRRLTITAERLSGANPGRKIRIERSLL
jgi:hypothetical protein